MTVSEQAAALLEWFGPNGERWCDPGAAGDGEDGERRCLMLGARTALPGATHEFFMAIEKAIEKALGWPTEYRAIAKWNDSHTWPDVKRLLESIRDGVQFTEATS